MRVKAASAWVAVLLSVPFLCADPARCADVGKGVKSSGLSLPTAADKGKAAPPHGPAAISGKATGVKGPLPDLVVSEIGLDEQCRVVLGVRNAGKGAIPDDAYTKGQIRVVAGGRQALIPFAKADPRGALKAPGGAARVESGLELEKEALVQAEVDSTRQVEESEEGNNQGREKLVPRCGEGQGKVGLEAGFKGVGKGEDAGPGRMGGKGLAAGPVLGGRQAADEEGCPVALEDLALSGNEVVAVLSRQGAGRIEAGEAGRIQLEVRAGLQHRMWPLSQVDPGLRQLNGSGGRVKYGTALKLEKPGPVMGRLLGCPGRALTRMLAPEGEGKGPGVVKMLPKPGGGDAREAAAPAEVQMRAEAVRPGPPEGTPTAPPPETTMASAGSITDRVMPYPARITSVSDPVYPGGTLTIRGIDFGSRQGQVKLVLIPHPYGVWLTCDIANWSGEMVQAVIPEHVADHITTLRDARIYLYPARVEERSMPPLSTEGEDATRYPYSGNEGPSYPFQIQPLTPSISRVSPLEVDEGGEFEILGLRFGDEPGTGGGVVLDGGSRNIPVEVVEWRETRIRVRVPLTALAAFSEDAVRGELRVTNKHRLEAAGASVMVNRVDDIDLKVAGVQVSGWDNECGRWDGTAGGLNDVCFDITPTVRNDGTDNAPGYHLEVTARPMGTKIYITTYDRAPGPAGGAETVLDAKAANCGDSTCDLTFNIPRRDTCTIRIHGNGTYPRPATCPD